MNDDRNDLFLETQRFINGLRPKVFVIENVDGILKGRMKGRFNQIPLYLLATGYRIKWKSMNSIYYGVPQSRQRVIIMGVREDIGKDPVFPEHNGDITRIGEVFPYVDYHSRGQFDKRLKSKDTMAYTVTKSPSMFFVENGMKRKPTIDELKVLSSLPDDFTLTGTYNQQWARIGNAVLPMMMKRIGSTIRKEIFSHQVN